MSRLVELEIARYKAHDMELAAVNLVTLFAKYSEIKGTNGWMDLMVKFHKNFQEEKPDGWTLNARGLDLTFSGFPRPVPTIEDDRIVLKAREPRFILEEIHEDLRPREKTQIGQVSEAIAMEMSEVYHMQVDNHPTELIFPKSVYASVERINAVML